VARNFKPQTKHWSRFRVLVDDMVDGGSTSAIVGHLLALARGKAA